MIEEEEKFEIKLTTLEALFADSATGGLSVFRTLSLSEEDDNGANDVMIRNFRQSFGNSLSEEEINYHIQNIKDIRKSALQDESLMMLLEDKVDEISSRIATRLISDEDNLMVTGEIETKED